MTGKANRQVTVLLNPSAGMGRSLNRRRRLERELSLAGVDYELVVTDSEAHLRALTRELGRRGGILAAAGGDSSLTIMASEVLAHRLDVTVAFIGLGSCNDIARELDVYTLRRACQALARGRFHAMDVGVVESAGKRLGIFLGQASLGLGVLVNREMAGVKPWRIPLASPPAVRRAFKSDRLPQRLTIDGGDERIEGDFLLLAASNIRYFACGRRALPGARTDDGRLDLILVRDCSFARLAMIARKSSRGRADSDPAVVITQAPSFHVRGGAPFHMQLDGELLGGNESPLALRDVRLGLLPGALRVVR